MRVLEFGSPSTGLAGSLLVAAPSLLDPNFRKSVIFISEDDAEQGTFGLVLNRPAQKSVADLVSGADLGALLRLPVFFGGPVDADQLTFAAFIWHAETDHLECRHHLDIEQALESLAAENTVVRAYIGYSGWTKGQLQGELAQKAWLVGKPNRDVLESTRCKHLWRDLLGSFGPWFKLIAEAPDDLSRN